MVIDPIDFGGRKLTIEGLLSFAVSLYFILVIALPGEGVSGLNIKAVVFIPLLVLMITRSAESRNHPWFSLSCVLGVPLLLSFWLMIAVWKDYDLNLAFAQYKYMILAISGCWFISVFTGHDRRRNIQFVRLIVFSMASVAALKLALVAYSAVKGVSIAIIVDAITKLFGVKLMTSDFDEVGTIGGRVQFISDDAIPLCCFAVLALRREIKVNRLMAGAFLLILIVSAGFSYSRFIWGYAVVSVSLGLLVAKRDKAVALSVILAVTSAVFAVQGVVSLIALRFSSAMAGVSDVARHDQIISLVNFFWDAPIIGHGFGSYPHDVIRDYLFPFSYEVELLALSAQVGIVGMVILALMLLWYIRKVLPFRGPYSLYRAAVLCLFSLFILGGLTNPMLLTSISAVSYGLVRAMGEARDS